MNSRRWVILAVAIVIGLVAGGLVYNYVQGVKDDANEDVVLVEVFTLTANIPKGTFGEDAFANGWVQRSRIAAEFRPATAITEPSQISGKVAISNLAANQVVVSDQFVNQSEALTTFSSLLDRNEVAITVTVDQVRGVAGLLVPGDYVNIMLTGLSYSTVGDPAAAPQAAAVGGATVLPPECNRLPAQAQVRLESTSVFCPQARYLYQKVQILAIGRQRELQPGETVATNPDGSPVSQGTGLLTLAVPPEAAQWIASIDSGSIYLTLVSEDFELRDDLGAIPPTARLPAEDPEALTPFGPEGEQAP